MRRSPDATQDPPFAYYQAKILAISSAAVSTAGWLGVADFLEEIAGSFRQKQIQVMQGEDGELAASGPGA